MIDDEMRALIEAPLANPLGLNLPKGRKPATGTREGPKYGQPGHMTKQQVLERKAKEEAAKLEQLFDYYAGTDKDPRTVATHMGLYRLQDTGRVDPDSKKPVFERVLDVERAEQALAARRNRG